MDDLNLIQTDSGQIKKKKEKEEGGGRHTHSLMLKHMKLYNVKIQGRVRIIIAQLFFL